MKLGGRAWLRGLVGWLVGWLVGCLAGYLFVSLAASSVGLVG